MVAVLAAVFHQPLPWFITTQGFPHIVKQRGWHIGVPHNIVIDPQQLFATEAGHVHKRIIGVGDDPLQIGFGDNRPVRERFFTPGDGLIQLHPLATPDYCARRLSCAQVGRGADSFFCRHPGAAPSPTSGRCNTVALHGIQPASAGALESLCNIGAMPRTARQRGHAANAMACLATGVRHAAALAQGHSQHTANI